MTKTSKETRHGFVFRPTPAASTIVALCSSLILLAGCASNEPFRTNAGLCEEGVGSSTCQLYSVERHNEKTPNGMVDHTLGIVEFSDQGLFHNRKQLDALMKELHDQARQHELLLFVFVHGWKHNASYCDQRMACFREMLKQLAMFEDETSRLNKRAPRKVFGIYVGWRGGSFTEPDFANSFSFWTRKNAALHVAQGQVRELFGRLKALHREKTGENTNDRSRDNLDSSETRMVIIGHSFGGLIVHAAVSQTLLNSAAEKENEFVKSFGDLVILINPAFEGTRYQAMYETAAHRAYPPGQAPVQIIFSSRTDDANKILFPLGRRFNAFFQRHINSEEYEANINAVGHIQKYRTHILSLDKEEKDAAALPLTQEQKEGKSGGGCQCEHLDQTILKTISIEQLKEEGLEFTKFSERSRDKGTKCLVNGWSRKFSDGIVLKHEEKQHAENPFWVVSVDPSIINGHSGFYTPAFLNFLRQLMHETFKQQQEGQMYKTTVCDSQ